MVHGLGRTGSVPFRVLLRDCRWSMTLTDSLPTTSPSCPSWRRKWLVHVQLLMLVSIEWVIISEHVVESSCCLPIEWSLIEFERSTKKRIGPSTRFYDNNISRPRTRFDLPGWRARLARTPAYFSITPLVRFISINWTLIIIKFCFVLFIHSWAISFPEFPVCLNIKHGCQANVT